MSYLSKHRPICAVIAEIRELAIKYGHRDISDLCDEARGYAERMSARLVAYKKQDEEKSR